MSTTTLREWLRAQLAAAQPGWRIVPSMRTIDNPDRITVIVKQSGAQPLPAAPRSWLLFELTLTLIGTHLDMERAEDQLDAELLNLIGALRTIEGVDFRDAKAVAWGDRLAYDVTVTADRHTTLTR